MTFAESKVHPALRAALAARGYAPRHALQVLALQVGAALAALAPVYWLGL